MKNQKTYKVSKQENFDTFLIHPAYINQDELKFSWTRNGKPFEKVVPLSHIGPHLKLKTMWKCDEELERVKYNGCAYVIPANVVENY